MKNTAINTLFLPIQNGPHPLPGEGEKVLFLNAQDHTGFSTLTRGQITAVQWFKPYADLLSAQNIALEKDPPSEDNVYDLALIALPKNRIESEYLTAAALRSLKNNALIIAAADNKAGGNRIEKTFKEFGLDNLNSLSKNKARVVWAHKNSVNDTSIKDALAKGQMQALNGTWTQAGIYGWDKIDRGSYILSQCLHDLKGHGADFGCGYGFLSLQALSSHPDIKSLTCAEADYRALQCCSKNLENFAAKTIFEWLDLTRETPFKNLDFIVMNPPFHEGKSTKPSIGISFIENAAKSLKRGGRLYMVANSHLPYEKPLENSFHKVEKIFEGDGFKVFEALR